MRLLVCGDRNWTNKELIRREVEGLRPDVVIHGAARGADVLGGMAARELGIEVIEFPAQWEKYGRAAGPIRNQQMLGEGKPTIVFAFNNKISESKGTKDMIRRARKAGLPVYLYTEPDGIIFNPSV